ncbi:MAG: DeoR/GlpR family DNA-binding transcription regulator [Hespellia sp.]|nr:DeoR/GlpR family DNA-binding transcription regulator [Hespellia sp.]
MIPLKERAEIILKEVEEKGSVRVADLSKIMGCSEVTIRSDITKLAQQRLLKKTYGGAVKNEELLEILLEPGETFLHRENKIRVAEKAYTYIENRESVLIESSTTGYYLAQCIVQHPEKRVIVVTNSVVIAALLSKAKHVELFLAGGNVMGTLPTTLDTMAIRFLEQFHIDKAFVGVNGINLETGLTAMGTPQMEMKRKMIEISRDTYVLADSSKFGNGKLFIVCPMSDVNEIITDSDVTKETLALAEKLNVKIVVV